MATGSRRELPPRRDLTLLEIDERAKAAMEEPGVVTSDLKIDGVTTPSVDRKESSEAQRADQTISRCEAPKGFREARDSNER